MNLEQRPLIEPGPGEMPSPLFTPQPGWGGRLHEWLRENAYLAVFRLVLFVAIVILVQSILRHRAPVPEPLASPGVPPASVQGHRPVASPGDSATALAARALEAHLAAFPDRGPLDAVQRLASVDRLAREAVATSSRQPFELNPGDSLFFPYAAVDAAIGAAKALTPAQRAAWSRYLR
jgi:hypothetical protein